MTDLFERVLLPIASDDDAAGTARAVAPYRSGFGSIRAVHVVEKAGGAMDKASVEQRERAAEAAFDLVRTELGDLETDIYYGTDVSETIFSAAADYDATSIVVTPRGGSRLVRLLTGDVALDLITDTDRPVVVLPDPGDGDGAAVESATEPAGDDTVGDDSVKDDSSGGGAV
ncbi:MAG: universal stress protein [Haloarculaceae archaeon]